ncbi:hypothetical protein G6F60_009179 [Rhizopus arrhizus]|nr:hypothetical protein G6F61_008980 [Rhizopus arrhizus]KAG1397161.1 hypothetical protein G6F60_009179 [Rhizopus arrhizus]
MTIDRPSPRFSLVKRPYAAESIVSDRDTFPYRSDFQLCSTLPSNKTNCITSPTLGVFDPVQLNPMAPHLDLGCVSGWQCSLAASTLHEPRPPLCPTRWSISSLLNSFMIESNKRLVWS